MKKMRTDVNYQMNLSDRITIEQGLCDGKSFTLIAGELHRDPSTIAKEVKRAIGFAEQKAYLVDCKYVTRSATTSACGRSPTRYAEKTSCPYWKTRRSTAVRKARTGCIRTGSSLAGIW